MNYQNVVSAVVRALAAETINSAGGCNVEPRVQASKLKGEITGKDAALLADCIVHKLLHAQLSPRHWNALVAKYSTHRGRKIDSMAACRGCAFAGATSLHSAGGAGLGGSAAVEGYPARRGRGQSSKASGKQG